MGTHKPTPNLEASGNQRTDVSRIVSILQRKQADSPRLVPHEEDVAVLVRDTGDTWQIVLQTDHADLSGQFVRAWSPRPEPYRSLEIVASRHDDGWAVWERAPGLDGEGRPRNFLDVQVPSHLAFYRAAIQAITDHDPYAGLLLSMHGAGIYNGRYGTQPDLKLTFADDVQGLVDAFVQEQEAGFQARIAALGVPGDERWRNYALLQVWDRFSLYFCLRDAEGGEAAEIAEYRLEPLGQWRISIDPFPFAESPAEFTLLRRLVPKRRWADDDEFREDFFAARIEPARIAVERA